MNQIKNDDREISPNFEKLSPFADKALPQLINVGFNKYLDQCNFQKHN